MKLNIQVNGDQVEDVCTQKLLGLHIDKELNFSDHVNVMYKKQGQRIKVLIEVKRHLLLKESKLYRVSQKKVSVFDYIYQKN